MNALEFIIKINRIGDENGCVWSHEQNRRASNSELRRWMEQGAIRINGETMSPKEAIDFPVFSIILFPKSEQKRITWL